MAAITGTGSLVASVATLVAVTFVPNTGEWDSSDRDWGSADAIYSEARPVMIVGTEFYQADAGSNFGGSPIEVRLSRSGLTIFGRDRSGEWKIDPTIIKEITAIYPVIRGIPGTIIRISIGSQNLPDDPIAWEGPYEFTLGVDFFKDFTVSGRYLAVRFESEDQDPWELLSYDLMLEVVGGF